MKKYVTDEIQKAFNAGYRARGGFNFLSGFWVAVIVFSIAHVVIEIVKIGL